MIILLDKYYSGDKIGKNEVGGACGTYGKKERCDRVLVGKTLSKRGNLEEPDVNERIILRWIFRKWDGCVAWTRLICLRTGTGDIRL